MVFSKKLLLLIVLIFIPNINIYLFLSRDGTVVDTHIDIVIVVAEVFAVDG